MPYRHPWAPRFCAAREHGGTSSETRNVRDQGAPRNASGVIQSRRPNHRKRTMGAPSCSFLLFTLYTDSEMAGDGSTASSLPTSRFGDLGSKSAKMSGRGASDMVHAPDLHNRDVETMHALRARHCTRMCARGRHLVEMRGSCPCGGSGHLVRTCGPPSNRASTPRASQPYKNISAAQPAAQRLLVWVLITCARRAFWFERQALSPWALTWRTCPWRAPPSPTPLLGPSGRQAAAALPELLPGRGTEVKCLAYHRKRSYPGPCACAF